MGLSRWGTWEERGCMNVNSQRLEVCLSLMLLCVIFSRCNKLHA